MLELLIKITIVSIFIAVLLSPIFFIVSPESKHTHENPVPDSKSPKSRSLCGSDKS